MTFWNYKTPFVNASPIFSSTQNIFSQTSVRLDKTDVVGAGHSGIVKAGHWLASIDGTNRVLPKSRLTVATSGTNTVTVEDASGFKVGDTLVFSGYRSKLTWDNTTNFGIGDTTVILYRGVEYTFTQAATAAPNAGGLQEIADFIAGHSYLKDKLYGQVTNTVLDIFTDGQDPVTVYSDNAYTTEELFLPSTYYIGGGAVTSIDYNTNALTLTSNTTGIFPIKLPVTVSGVVHVLGIHPHVIDFTERTSIGVNAITEASGVYEVALSHLDEGLKQKFPRIGYVG